MIYFWTCVDWNCTENVFYVETTAVASCDYVSSWPNNASVLIRFNNTVACSCLVLPGICFSKSNGKLEIHPSKKINKKYIGVEKKCTKQNQLRKKKSKLVIFTCYNKQRDEL